MCQKSEPVELAFKAELGNLDQVQAAVEDFAESKQLSAKASYALSLCLEELLTNVVNHGSGEGTKETEISLALALIGEEVQVIIEDNGTPYDPTETPEPDLDALLEDRPIGGLGVHLVRELAHRFEYSHEGGKNRVQIAIERRLGAEG